MVGFRRRVVNRRVQEQTDALPERLVMALDPSNPAAEAYRLLRTNLLYAFGDNSPKAIMLTSPGPREGKSTTCANLGVALTQASKRTLIVDCDLRKPVMHKIFGLRNFRGIVNVIAGEHDVQSVLQEPLPGLNVITVGPTPPNPAELLGSTRFAAFVKLARQEFDYVLMDAPPVEPVSDPVIIATRADGVLLIIDAQNTRKGALRQSIRSLEAVGANVIGTVMNNFKAPRGSYYGYGNYT
jgi:capsular exopolysaccharide synthesis family protein